MAWDPVAQIARWTQDVGLPYEGGTLVTAGNLVFQGTTDGHFNAYRADTGERVYSFHAGSGILGAPSTVKIDGRQLILVAAGSGTTSAVGFAQKLSGTAPGPARLLAFAIDGRTKLPPLPPGRDPIPLPPAAEPNAAPAKEGNTVWDANGCELCHGFKAVDGLGSVPDLRRIPAPHYDVFSQIIRGGLFKATGMPVFADSIREEDLAALKAYLIGEAWKGYRAEQASKPQP